LSAFFENSTAAWLLAINVVLMVAINIFSQLTIRALSKTL
jgi:hypothetical protein